MKGKALIPILILMIVLLWGIPCAPAAEIEGDTETASDAADAEQKTAPPGEFIALPESMGPVELAKILEDQPGSLDVVDIRPAWQFNEYHIPGAVNVPARELMTTPAYLDDKRPLVIVCRDGHISAAVGGALIQKARRPIRFLSGGVIRYYDEIMRPPGIKSETLPSGTPSVQGVPSQMPDTNAPAPGDTPADPDSPPAQGKNAGC